MNDFHGIIFAYKAYPELRELVANRTSASLPVCGNYRLIDFALSSLRNAGITDVGVVMQRDYQSLLDHLSSGKPWDMAKREGGLKMLPPFGLPQYHKGDYSGTIEALNAVSNYIHEIPQKYVVLLLGNLCANLDLGAVCKQHLSTGVGVTAICGNYQPDVPHHRFLTDENGYINKILFDRIGPGEGMPSLEGFVISKEILLDLMDKCKAKDVCRFHHDALSMFIEEGGKMRPYVHECYARFIRTVDGYYAANMDMLDPVNRAAVFPEDRPIRAKNLGGVSTYYGENAKLVNSLVSDNCIIRGTVENCIIFGDVCIEEGAEVKDSILLKGTVVGKNAILHHVIADKDVEVSANISLMGSEKLPIVIPKGAKI